VEKRGLAEQLAAAGVTRNQHTLHCDEMRFGLWGQVRRRWGRKGVKIIQKVQIEFAWQYLVLAVDVVRNQLTWQWAERMNQDQLVPLLAQWQPDAVVWDGAAAHRGQRMAALGFACISLPPYSPELNPPERVFEYLRAEIEGTVYASLLHKRRAIDQSLRKLNADKHQLRSLIGWQWIHDNFQQLPDT
jgi:transposase